MYRKLAQDRPGTFLLESAEHGGVWSRYSIVGVRSHAVLTEARRSGGVDRRRAPRGNSARRESSRGVGGDPSGASHAACSPTCRHSPVVSSGTCRTTRSVAGSGLPDANPDELRVPEIGLMLATDLAVLDHADGSVLLIANAINFDDTDERVAEAWSDAVKRLDVMTRDLGTPAEATVAVTDADRGAGVHVTHRSCPLSRVGRARQGGDRGRRVFPDRREPAL